jgi:uncharacterized membrane protein
MNLSPLVRRSEDDELSQGGSREQAYGLGRLLAISDGVFAFALTLLVVQLMVPRVSYDLVFKGDFVGTLAS